MVKVDIEGVYKVIFVYVLNVNVFVVGCSYLVVIWRKSYIVYECCLFGWMIIY